MASSEHQVGDEDQEAGPTLPEDDEVLISAIEHYSYCPRQWALIHVEQTYEENVYTVRGRLAHERVDSGDDTPARGVPVARSAPLWSARLRLRGKADLIELRPEGPYPVEYKSGPKPSIHAQLQLCAQALCLEEMLDVPVPRGAIYSRATRKRYEVVFTEALRTQTLAVIEEMRARLHEERLPTAPNDARCPNCSLFDACLPGVVAEPARLRGLQGALFRPLVLTDVFIDDGPG